MRIGEATNERDLLVALEGARQRRMGMRRGREATWWNNLALIAGDHHSEWNPNMGTFEDRDQNFDAWDDTKKPRMVINHALTVARTELSKLTKAHPIMEIIANSNEPEDIAATKVGKAGLDYAEWKFKLRALRKQALWWMIPAGVAAIYCGWDYYNDQAGSHEFIIDPNTGEPTFNKKRQQELQDMVDNGELDELEKESYPLGEIDYQLKTPFQILPDEGALTFDTCRDLITIDSIDYDVAVGKFGRKVSSLNPETSQLGTMEQRFMQRLGAVIPASEALHENSLKTYCYWLEPGVYRGNRFLRDGIYVCWAQGKVLEISTGFPYQDSRLPFVFFSHIPSGSSIWPDCTITHVRGPNLEIDKTVSQLVENKDYMSNPMWRIATQHKVKGEIKNVAGGIVRYVHVPNIPPPEPIQGLQMPAQVESLLAGLREQILDISGQSEVARGRVPTGVRSGVAVAYLQEEDDTKIAPTIENMEEAIALMGSLTLERFAQFYTTERIIRYYRRDGKFDVLKFKGADLRNNTDVVCQAGSAMPKSKAARQQYTLELVSLGILTDPRQIQEMLDLGNGEPDNNDKAVAQADRENNIMLHGLAMNMFHLAPGASQEEQQRAVSAAIPVKQWHNHTLHIQRHTSVMMDEEFDRLAISNPGIVRLFDEHIALHEQMLAQQQQQQMQMQLAAKGAPESAGGTPAGDQANSGVQGANGDVNRTVSRVPDLIGGGNLQITSHRTHPQPG